MAPAGAAAAMNSTMPKMMKPTPTMSRRVRSSKMRGSASTARLRAAADLRVPLFDRFPEAFWALAFSLLVLVLRATVPLDLKQVHDDHGTLLGALPEKREKRVAGGLGSSLRVRSWQGLAQGVLHGVSASRAR